MADVKTVTPAGRPKKPQTRAAHYQKRYGLNPIAAREAADGLKAGEKCCAICGGRASGLDHNHHTGLARGFLCRGCNFGLGSFRDNPELLDLARRYLHTTKRRAFPGIPMEPIVIRPVAVACLMRRVAPVTK